MDLSEVNNITLHPHPLFIAIVEFFRKILESLPYPRRHSSKELCRRNIFTKNVITVCVITFFVIPLVYNYSTTWNRLLYSAE